MPLCEAGPGRRTARRFGGHRGIALLAALIVLSLLSAMGLGLVLTTSLEPAVAANYECGLRARYVAEAGVAVAAHELAAMADWDPALSGLAGSLALDRPEGDIGLPDGTTRSVQSLTNLANCGHSDACTDRELSAFTTDRPWGPNNPRWQPFGVLRLERVAGAGEPRGVSIAMVWVADDPAELDGDPRRDSTLTSGGARRPGACVVAIRAEAFSGRAAHRTVTATIARPTPACGPGARLVSWQETS